MKGTIYYRFNPIIHFVIRPTLKLVDAHNHPIRGGIASSIASLLAHYAAVLLSLWTTDIVEAPATLPIIVHVLLAVNALSNLAIGVIRYMENEYGDRPK